MKLKILITFILCLMLNPIVGNAQITFEKSQKELIDLGSSGTIKAFIREISSDSLFVVWKVSDLKATGSDNIFMAYESESHSVEFKATYNDLENLALWINNRKKNKTGGTVSLGEWTVSYVQSAFGLPIFTFTGSTGNFDVGISKQMCKRFMSRKNIERAIDKFKQQKEWQERREAKKKIKGMK